MTKPLDRMPEAEDAMRARFGKAVDKAWTVAQAEAGDSPALLRDHVFDFGDGLRMIASMTDLGNGPRLHASFSWFPDTPFAAMAAALGHTGVLAQLAARFKRVSGKDLPPAIGASGKGVFHFTDAR